MANAKYRVNGEKKVPGYDDPDIEVEVDDQYEAYSKGSVPDAGDYQVGNETIRITWFNNFGVRLKSTGKNADVTYTVKLKKLPTGKRLFALYGGSAHELATEDASEGNIKFQLSVGDPPLGSGP